MSTKSTVFLCQPSRGGLEAEDPKVCLLRTALAHFADRWKAGDAARFAWLYDELDAIEREFNDLNEDELRRRLRSLCKRLAFAKGLRHHVPQQPDQRNAPWWHEPTSTITAAAMSTHNGENNSIINNKGDTMPTFVTVPTENTVLIKRGEHPAVIKAVGEPEVSKFDEEKQSLKLTFEIIDGEFAGHRLTKWFTCSLASKANLGQLWRRLKGEPKAGVQVDLDELVGEKCSVVVTHKTGDDGDYNVISDVFAPVASAVGANNA